MNKECVQELSIMTIMIPREGTRRWTFELCSQYDTIRATEPPVLYHMHAVLPVRHRTAFFCVLYLSTSTLTESEVQDIVD